MKITDENNKTYTTLTQADLSAAQSVMQTSNLSEVWGLKKEIKGIEAPAQFFASERAASHVMERFNFPVTFKITSADVKRHLKATKEAK